MRYIQHGAGTLYEYTDVSAFAHCRVRSSCGAWALR